MSQRTAEQPQYTDPTAAEVNALRGELHDLRQQIAGGVWHDSPAFHKRMRRTIQGAVGAGVFAAGIGLVVVATAMYTMLIFLLKAKGLI